MDAVGVAERPDAADAKAHIRARGERISERERDRALERLRACGDLSEREARVIEEVAKRLTDALLTVPESHLDVVDSGGEASETAAVALQLFGEN